MTDIPKKAKAAVMVKPLQVEVREVPIIPPKPGSVLVKILRANICGSDLHMFRGEAFGGMDLPFAFVMGHEMMGKVAALGAGVERDTFGNTLRVGDLITFSYFRGCGTCMVCARGKEHACVYSLLSVVNDVETVPHLTGGFAEYYYVRPGQKIIKVPEGTPDYLVAGCNCAIAQVFHGLRTVNVGVGDQVVIQGAGGLGLFATAVAKKMGASKVIVIDGVKVRLDLAKEFGADHVVSLQDEPDPKQRRSQIHGLTNGGPDVCVEVVGRPEAVNEGIRLLQRGGRYLIMGSINPRLTFKADPSIWVGENLTLYGVSLYDTMSLLHAIQFVKEEQDRLPLKKMFAQTYPLTKIAEAFETADALTNQKTNALRIQLTMDAA